MQGSRSDRVLIDDIGQPYGKIQAMNGENNVYFYCPDCGTLAMVDSPIAEQEVCGDCGDDMLQINRKYYHTLQDRME